MKVCLSCGEHFISDGWRCPSCNTYPEIINGFVSFAPNLAMENDGFGPEYFERLFKVVFKVKCHTVLTAGELVDIKSIKRGSLSDDK